MAEQTKAPTIKADYLSSTLRAHIVEGREQIPRTSSQTSNYTQTMAYAEHYKYKMDKWKYNCKNFLKSPSTDCFPSGLSAFLLTCLPQAALEMLDSATIRRLRFRASNSASGMAHNSVSTHTINDASLQRKYVLILVSTQNLGGCKSCPFSKAVGSDTVDSLTAFMYVILCNCRSFMGLSLLTLFLYIEDTYRTWSFINTSIPYGALLITIYEL